MKRLFLSIFALVTLLQLAPVTAFAGVNDFHFNKFEADYYLSKDSEGRSKLKVVEQLTAEFPTFNQNKGIKRAIPARYDGHSVSFHLDSLKRNGQPEPVYSKDTVKGNIVIGTGTDDYVTGTQVYQFTYTLRDVTKDFGDHQELYWDTNGTEWQQSFDSVVARVHVDKSVRSAFAGDTRCFVGKQDSSSTCDASKPSADTVLFSGDKKLNAGENMTLVMKFKADTFAAAPLSLMDILGYVLSVISAAVLAAGIYILRRFGRDAPGRGTIIPEYLPPKNISPLFAAGIYGNKAKAISAQIIDLAVQHKISLSEKEKKGLFGIGNSTVYVAKITSVDNLSHDEQLIMKNLFGAVVPGSTYEFDKTDTPMGTKLRKTQTKTWKTAESEHYRSSSAGATTITVFLTVVATVTIIGGLAYLSDQLSTPPAQWIVAIVLAGISIGLFSYLFSKLHPLTPKGRELYDYLKGLKMYIKLAEAERLRVLQSPEGAQKSGIDSTDDSQLVNLYERLLPYAVLFGQEKEWAKVLAIHYDQTNTQPSWYSGTHAFNAGLFASSISNFSSTATNFSSPSSSGSSGFGGGGFSGGGGGGGGGGGR